MEEYYVNTLVPFSGGPNSGGGLVKFVYIHTKRRRSLLGQTLIKVEYDKVKLMVKFVQKQNITIRLPSSPPHTHTHTPS